MLQPSVVNLLNGYGSSLAMCYGVTNSGKTYTMIGDYQQNSKNKGLLLRFVHDLIAMKSFIKEQIDPNFQSSFDLKNQELDKLYSKIYQQRGSLTHEECGELKLIDLVLRFEAIEIYNNKIYDLAHMVKKSQKKPHVSHKQHKLTCVKKLKEVKGNVQIKEQNVLEVNSYSEFVKLLELTQKFKSMANNNVNSNSSRSHTLYKIHVDYVYKNTEEKTTPLCLNSIGCLQLVDLAGSERLDNTLAKIDNAFYNKQIQKEAIEINKSLSNLKRCFEHKLAKSNFEQIRGTLTNEAKKKYQRKIPPVNYRASKLTLLFREAFEQNWNVTLICAMDKSQHSYLESQRSLEFCSQMKNIKLKASNKFRRNLNVQKHQKKKSKTHIKYKMVVTKLEQKLNEKDEIILKMQIEMKKMKEPLEEQERQSEEKINPRQLEVVKLKEVSKKTNITFREEEEKQSPELPIANRQSSKSTFSRFSEDIFSQLSRFSQIKQKKFQKQCLQNLTVKRRHCLVTESIFKSILKNSGFYDSIQI